MLVQSYNNTARVFPAVPETWKNVRLYNARVENGMTVSGKLGMEILIELSIKRMGRLFQVRRHLQVAKVAWKKEKSLNKAPFQRHPL